MARVEELIQSKLSDKRAWQARELNLEVCGLPSSNANLVDKVYAFLRDQLELSEICIDRAWIG